MTEHLRLGRISAIPIGLSPSVVAPEKTARLPAAARVLVLVLGAEHGTVPGTVTAGDTNRQPRRAASTAGSR